MAIIFIHELGHFLAASILNWKTDKIYLYPYGGISKFNTLVNTSLKEELFVLLMGPIFQIVFVNVLYMFISNKNIELVKEYHYFLLFFNLLPIYPLDGGKLLNILILNFLSFKKTFKIIIKISYTVLVLTSVYFLYKNMLIFILILLFLIQKIYQETKDFPYIFEKFLLERKLYKFYFPKKKVISNINDMKKDTLHLFKTSGKYFLESEYLKKYSVK